MSKWYTKKGIDDDVVIESCITLSRNLYDYPYASKITDGQSLQLIEDVAYAFFSEGDISSKLYKFTRLDTLRKHKRAYWVEHQLVDKSVLDAQRPQALISSKNESAGIWINGDNHIQIRAVLRGRQIGKAYEMARFLDDWLSGHLIYAYNKKYGHLTTSLSDIGTGLHVSYLMRLDMIKRAGLLKSIGEQLSKSGFSMEKDEIFGTECGVYKIFNKKTLGATEADILDMADDFVDQLVTHERDLRNAYLSADREAFVDKTYKAYGILRYAKLLNVKDAMQNLYLIEQGVNGHYVDVKEGIDIFPLMIEVQSSSLRDELDDCFEKHDEDKYRAAFIRKKLPEIVSEQDLNNL